MKSMLRNLAMCAFLPILCLGPSPASAQTKPLESTSKVKKVLLYNKIGGWVAVEGIAEIKSAFSKLAATKGFELVQSSDDASITLDYLKQFQVIVWNNNSNGGASMPSTAARQAVLDYMEQGGGWLLIHRAGDHADSWPGLSAALGTQFTQHGVTGPGEIVLDAAAKAHRELKWMLEGFPAAFGLNDRWLSFSTTVRPLSGVTVIATARAGAANVLPPMGDGSGDHVYLWQRNIGQGRLIYNAIGSGLNEILGQQDSVVPRLYWENLRYAAGDYLNGCMTPGNPNFDPAARVHDDGRCFAAGLQAAPAQSELVVSKGGMRMQIASPAGPFLARLRDFRGALIWEQALTAGTGELVLDDAIKPGVYLIEVRSDAGAFRRRLLLP